MRNETIKNIELKLAEEVLKSNNDKLKYIEIVNLIKATTTFQAVINIVSNHDAGLTISELKENSELLSSIYINCYRINKKINDIDELIKI